MQPELKLFMMLLGGRSKGRHTEQHDVFFGIAVTLKELVPEIKAFWPDAVGLHVDAWIEVNNINGYQVTIQERAGAPTGTDEYQLFFINLGGYIRGLFDEPHFKMLTVQSGKDAAISYAKNTQFYKTIQFEGARSHIDDMYGVDVDDLYSVAEILPTTQKEKYKLVLSENKTLVEDQLHLGYFKLSALP